MYFWVGQILVLSLLNGGPGPGCFSSLLYQSLYSERSAKDLVLENVSNPDHAEALKSIECSQSFLDLNKTIAEHSLFALTGHEQEESADLGNDPLPVVKTKIFNGQYLHKFHKSSLAYSMV